MIEIGTPELRAVINPLGAELTSLRDRDGNELLTNGDPAFWASHAPLLFPIVGELRGGVWHLDGQRHAMGRHGIARRQMFTLEEQEADHVRFRLTGNAEIRESYPFDFALDAEYRIEDSALLMRATAHNRDVIDMPASFGFHPGFAWPLPYGQPRAAHRILFDEDEPDDLCLLESNLIVREDRPSPVQSRVLPLRDDLFEHDALIWSRARSRGCLYGAPDGPQLRIAWSDMPSLGIWTKPGASYVCIEPWDGSCDRADFSGEIWDKAGIHRIAPGEQREWWMRVAVEL